MTTTAHNHSHSQNRFAVIPTPVRLKTGTEFSGKNVTIAFLDSGFFPHPDLLEPVSRIIAFHDVTGQRSLFNERQSPESWDWHGTMTSVVAAGNGSLSSGIYRGLAYESNVVLVKVGDRGKITEENICRGLEWVIENKDRYNIRIVSISLGGDQDVPYQTNQVDLAAERALEAGLVVVVASGNSGCSNRHHTVPPANSPGVITVGGYDDGNQFESNKVHLYCSSYGATADGILKPEIIAPAIWIAAPILPDTDEYRIAQALTELYETPDYLILAKAQELWKIAGLSGTFAKDPQELRSLIERALQQSKIISPHYQHVDGTSFAAPISSSVIALMLQANPSLTPAAVKNILISSAHRIPDAPLLRQGFGMLNAPSAIELARKEHHSLNDAQFMPPRVAAGKLAFHYHNDTVNRVDLAAEFLGWNQFHPFLQDKNGTWQATVDTPPPGRYRYKFVLNGNQWIEDPGNGFREPDEFGGFNSIVHILRDL